MVHVGGEVVPCMVGGRCSQGKREVVPWYGGEVV